jgi:outer membrane receptor protein involved in Fe transport
VLGPNSALYGANAVTAVINIVTRTPGADFRADVSVSAGAHGATVIDGSVEGGFGPVALRCSGGIDRVNSWMGRHVPGKDIVRGNATLRIDIPGGKVTANGGFAAGSGRMFGTVGYVDFKEFLFAHVKAGLQLGDLKSRAYWYRVSGIQKIELDLVHPSTGIVLGKMPIMDAVIDIFHMDGQYDLEPFENNLLIAGVDLRASIYRSEQLVNSDTREYRIGFFLHDEQRLWDKWLVTAGARFDWNSVTKQAISPRAALVYNPAEGHFLRFSAGRAFRKPTLVETRANLRVDENPAFPEIDTLFEHEDYGISNPDLENEILTAVELGYRGSLLGRSLRIGTDVYFGINQKWIEFQTDIRFIGIQIDLVNSSLGHTNTGTDTNIVGVNFSIEGEPTEALTLFFRGEYRYMWLVETGSWYGLTPSLLGSAGGVLRLPFGLTAHLAVVHIGGREDEIRDPSSILAPNVSKELPARTYLLGALNYRLKLGRSRLDLGLTLFNPFGGRYREKIGVPAPDGSNYGGESLGTKALLTARFRY